VEDVERYCVQCGVRKHSSWDDPACSMLSYLCEARPCINKDISIAQRQNVRSRVHSESCDPV